MRCLCISLTTLSLLFSALSYANKQPTKIDIVQRFVQAYNKSDVEAMLALAHADIIWQYVDGKKITVETHNAQALKKSMSQYFPLPDGVFSRIISSQQQGSYVSVVEEANWQVKGKAKKQCALAIYYIEQAKILSVSYYPASSCSSTHN